MEIHYLNIAFVLGLVSLCATTKEKKAPNYFHDR